MKGSGAVRKNTRGWLSKDKYSLLSADYNLSDLRQPPLRSLLKKKIITGLTMKSFREGNLNTENSVVYSIETDKGLEVSGRTNGEFTGQRGGERDQADSSFSSSLSLFCQPGGGCG